MYPCPLAVAAIAVAQRWRLAFRSAIRTPFRPTAMPPIMATTCSLVATIRTIRTTRPSSNSKTLQPANNCRRQITISTQAIIIISNSSSIPIITMYLYNICSSSHSILILSRHTAECWLVTVRHRHTDIIDHRIRMACFNRPIIQRTDIRSNNIKLCIPSNNSIRIPIIMVECKAWPPICIIHNSSNITQCTSSTNIICNNNNNSNSHIT